jgi:D-arabinose 1-dehydrogenase-like Zn-dependent alcohol dehydrogenase
VVYGMTLAPQMPFTMQAVLKNLEVRGTTMGSRKEFGNMVGFVKEKKIHPAVSRVVEGIDNFDAIESLFQDLKHGRQFGKLVITLSADATRGKL